MNFSQKNIGQIAVFFEVLLWSAFPLFIRASHHFLPPLFFAAGANFFAGLFFLAVAIFRRKSFSKLFSRAVFPSAIAGIFLISILLFSILFWAGQKTSAGNLAILMTSEIFWTFLIFSFLKLEKITVSHFFGAFLVGGGAIFLLAKNFSGHFFAADFVIFLAMAIAPVGNFFQKKVLEKISPEVFGAFRSFLAAIFLFLAALFFEDFSANFLTARGLFLTIFTGFFLFGFSKFLFFVAIKNLGVPIAAAITNAAPVLTLFYAAIFLSEKPTAAQIFAIFPIFLGILFLNDFFSKKTFVGEKISGDGRGTKIGFPTINLKLSKKIPRGVFAVFLFFHGKKFRGVAHFGARPTFLKNEFSAEIHCFDFSKKISDGEKIKFQIVKKIRDIQKFKNAEKLAAQIQKDKITAKKLLKKN